MPHCGPAGRPAPAGKVINVGTGDSCTLNQTIKVLNSIFGVEVKPRYALPREGDVRHSTADISLARADAGLRADCGFDEGLRRTVDWLRAVLAAKAVTE